MIRDITIRHSSSGALTVPIVCCNYCRLYFDRKTEPFFDSEDNYAIHQKCWWIVYKNKIKKTTAKISASTTIPISNESVATNQSKKANNWKTKEGVVIPISEMSDSHLINSIHLLRRKAVEMSILGQVDIPTGLILETDKRYHKLTDEANRRGISTHG